MSRIKDLQWEVAKLKDTQLKLEAHVKQLMCKHELTHLCAEVSYHGPWGSWTDPWREECIDCGKTLRTFDTEREWLQAKLERARAECSENIGAIEREIEELGDES